MRMTAVLIALIWLCTAVYAGEGPGAGAATKAAALTRQSAAARKAGKYRTCLALAGRAIKAAPAYPYAYVERGRCHFALGMDAAAKADIDEAARLAPGDAAVRSAGEELAAAMEQRGAAERRPEENQVKKLQPLDSPLNRKAAPDAEEDAAPVKPDGKRCIHPGAYGDRRYCNWYDALDYCGGRLPTVEQLLELNMRECPAGSKSLICGCRVWSADDGGGGTAKTVIFANGGDVEKDDKNSKIVFVFCLK